MSNPERRLPSLLTDVSIPVGTSGPDPVRGGVGEGDREGRRGRRRKLRGGGRRGERGEGRRKGEGGTTPPETDHSCRPRGSTTVPTPGLCLCPTIRGDGRDLGGGGQTGTRPNPPVYSSNGTLGGDVPTSPSQINQNKGTVRRPGDEVRQVVGAPARSFRPVGPGRREPRMRSGRWTGPVGVSSGDGS